MVLPAEINPIRVKIQKMNCVIIFFQCHFGYLFVLVYNIEGIRNQTIAEQIPPINLIYPDISEYTIETVQHKKSTTKVTIIFFFFVIVVVPQKILNKVSLNAL